MSLPAFQSPWALPSRLLATVLMALPMAAMVAAADPQPNQPGYYSTKQPYLPQGAGYSPAPDGFRPIHTQSLDRHGSRGLSGFKYDDLAEQMLVAARREGALTELGLRLIPQVHAMIMANRALPGGFGQGAGYGNLTQVGRQELQGIGGRCAQRNADLLRRIQAEGLRISFTSSGEPRATDSGWNFGQGLLDEHPGIKGNVDFDRAAGHVEIEVRPDLLYAHKDAATPGYQRYQAWKDGSVLKDKVQAAYAEPQARQAARDLLEKIFSPAFVDEIERGARRFSAREDDDEVVEGIVDAALQFYNLYIIAPALAQERATPQGGWIFQRYMDAENGPLFAWLLDVEDYYEKGPAIAGQTVAYDNYEPLLEEMLASIERRAEGGRVAADFRFAHAEALIPLAALLKTPGLEQGVPADQVMDYENSHWRGDTVAPMAGNIQWDAFANADGRVIVRMLYNEKEIPFKEGCLPVAEGSVFYTLDELQACLPLNKVSDHSAARL